MLRTMLNLIARRRVCDPKMTSRTSNPQIVARVMKTWKGYNPAATKKAAASINLAAATMTAAATKTSGSAAMRSKMIQVAAAMKKSVKVAPIVVMKKKTAVAKKMTTTAAPKKLRFAAKSLKTSNSNKKVASKKKVTSAVAVPAVTMMPLGLTTVAAPVAKKVFFTTPLIQPFATATPLFVSPLPTPVQLPQPIINFEESNTTISAGQQTDEAAPATEAPICPVVAPLMPVIEATPVEVASASASAVVEAPAPMKRNRGRPSFRSTSGTGASKNKKIASA